MGAPNVIFRPIVPCTFIGTPAYHPRKMCIIIEHQHAIMQSAILLWQVRPSAVSLFITETTRYAHGFYDH